MTLSDDVNFARKEFLSLWQTCVCASCLLTLTAASLSLPSELEKSKLKQCIAMLGKQLNTFHTYSIFVDLFLSDFVVGNFVKCNFELLLWGDLHPIKIENLWRRFFLVEHILHLWKESHGKSKKIQKRPPPSILAPSPKGTEYVSWLDDKLLTKRKEVVRCTTYLTYLQ